MTYMGFFLYARCYFEILCNFYKMCILLLTHGWFSFLKLIHYETQPVDSNQSPALSSSAALSSWLIDVGQYISLNYYTQWFLRLLS